jgi:hypothetical protein
MTDVRHDKAVLYPLTRPPNSIENGTPDSRPALARRA